MTTATSDSNLVSGPPITQVGPLAWLRKNLFDGWFNSILTLVCLAAIVWVGWGFIQWAFLPPPAGAEIDTTARWFVLSSNMRLFFTGRYPSDLVWRTWVSFFSIAGLTGLSWGVWSRKGPLFNPTSLSLIGTCAVLFFVLSIITGINNVLETCQPTADQPFMCWGQHILSGFTASPRLWGVLVLIMIAGFVGQRMGQVLPAFGSWLPLIWLASFFLIFGLLQGGLFLQPVALSRVGQTGLLLTLLTALVSIVVSFPIGILLALGRQSPLPVIRGLSIIYIEFVRGLPLIGILFMAQVMLPLVLPVGFEIPTLYRAMAGLTIFSAAYLAENVRGGLQSIPRGQIEAAKALGLNAAFLTLLIVLPQALKAVIPTIVGQFISLFKDTSLLFIVGLAELVGMSQSVLSNPNYLGRHAEVYLFVAAIYFVCCYAMSFASRRIENQMGVGQR